MITIPDFISQFSGQIYSWTYILPFYLVALGMLYSGWRAGYPMLSYTLILLSGRMGFTLGSWLGTLGTLSSHSGRSTVFALLLGLLAAWSAIRLLRFEKPVLDLYALYIPLGLAIQRLGCLAVGCCFGSPTQQAWGILYDSHSLPAHFHSHLVPLHPFPLYIIFGLISTFALLVLVKKRISFQGGVASLGLFLIFLGRFISEFFRDPLSNQSLGQAWMGIKQVQWVVGIMALGSLIAFIALYKRHQKLVAIPHCHEPAQSISQRQTLLFGIILLTYMASWPILNTQEWISSLPILAITLLAFLWNSSLAVWARLGIGLVGATALAIASQADSSQGLTYWFSDTRMGSYRYPTSKEDGCMGDTYSNYKTQRYAQQGLGLGASYESLKGIRTYVEGELSLFSGKYLNDESNGDLMPIGFRTHIQANAGWFGFKFGVHNPIDPTDNVNPSSLRPFGSFQIGNFRNGYLVGGVAADYAYTPYFGLGGATQDGRMRLEIGLSTNALFTELKYRWNNGYGLQFKGQLSPSPRAESEFVQESQLRIVRNF